jgi:hypothetical protein
LRGAGYLGFCAVFGIDFLIAHNGRAKKHGVSLLNYLVKHERCLRRCFYAFWGLMGRVGLLPFPINAMFYLFHSRAFLSLLCGFILHWRLTAAQKGRR